MKTSKKFKIKYIYNKPNTPEEKERQEKRIAEVYIPLCFQNAKV